jgi:hypothetical protein
MFTPWLDNLVSFYTLTGLNALVASGVLVSALELVPIEWLDDLKRFGLARRDWFFQKVLGRRAMTRGCVAAWGVALLLSVLFGGVRVTSDETQHVSIRASSGSGCPSSTTAEKVKGGNALPYTCFSPVWRTDKVGVDVDGLPRRQFALRHWWPTPVELPDALYESPVVLLVMSDQVLRDVGTKGNAGRLDITVTCPDGGTTRTAKVPDFDGRSVWIGCDENVRVPDHVETRWKQANWIEQYRQRRVSTVGTVPSLELTPGAIVKVTLAYGKNLDQTLAAKPFTVKQAGPPTIFPQVEDFQDGP